MGQVMHFKLNPLPSCSTIILTVLGHAISLNRNIANAVESHILFCPRHEKATICLWSILYTVYFIYFYTV